MINKAPAYNFASVIAVRILPALLYIYALPLFLKAHGKSSYAQLVIVVTMISLSIIFDSASNYFFFNRFARRSEACIQRKIGIYYPTLLIFGMGLYALSAISTVAYFSVHFPPLLGLAILFAVAPVSLGSSLIYSFWQVSNKGYLGNLTRSLTDIFKAGGLLIGANVNDGFAIALIIYVAGFYLRFCTDLMLFRKHIEQVSTLDMPRDNYAKVAAVFFKKTYPVWATAFVSSVLQFLDKPISYLLFGERQMVQLAMAAEISSKVVLIQYAAAFVFTYYLGKTAKHQSENLRLTWLFLSTVVIVIIIFIMPLYVYAQAILNAWLGADIAEESYQMLRLLLIAQAIYMIGNVFEVRNTFTAAAQKNILPYALMLVTYFCSLFLLSDMGVVAVAYSLILAQLVVLLYFARSVFP